MIILQYIIKLNSGARPMNRALYQVHIFVGIFFSFFFFCDIIFFL